MIIAMKAFAILSLPILSAGMDGHCWAQLGAGISGASDADSFGSAVSLSKDGSTIAIGAFDNDEIATDAGHVRVYGWDTRMWVQRGDDIEGVLADELFGSSVSMSQDGSKLAVGSLGHDTFAGRAGVYIWDSDRVQWVKFGQDLAGDDSYASIGGKDGLSMSGDGKYLAVGSPGNDDNGTGAGEVKIYDISQEPFITDFTINGGSGDLAGTSVSLSEDGSTVVIGEIGDNDSGYYSGKVRVFVKDDNELWTQKGKVIYGENSCDGSGETVSVSNDGTVVAIASLTAVGNGDDDEKLGHVRVFAWSGEWKQRGHNIEGQEALDRLGTSVSLSGSGNTIAIGATGNDGNGNLAGRVRVFDWNDVSWSERESIDGEAAGDQSGYSVSLSDDGNIVAIGHLDNGNQVRVFQHGPCKSKSRSSKSIKADKKNSKSKKYKRLR